MSFFFFVVNCDRPATMAVFGVVSIESDYLPVQGRSGVVSPWRIEPLCLCTKTNSWNHYGSWRCRRGWGFGQRVASGFASRRNYCQVRKVPYPTTIIHFLCVFLLSSFVLLMFVVLVVVVVKVGDLKAPFSIATTWRCREGCLKYLDLPNVTQDHF